MSPRVLWPTIAVVASATTSIACSGPFGADAARARYYEAPASNAIHDQYVVLLADASSDIAAEADRIVDEVGGELLNLYDAALRGFAARIPDDSLDELRSDSRVSAVYQDLWLAFSASGSDTQFMDANGDPWGLDRIDQTAHPLDRQYVYDFTGSGVTAYVIDSGIDATHPDLGGRAVNQLLTSSLPGCAEDELGHGTAVASIIGGATYGVAKDVDIVGLRVAPCGDPRPLFSLVLRAVDWVSSPSNRVTPSVVNLSLGWRLADPIDPWRVLIEDLIQRTIDQGVPYVVSANNVGGDACEWWPARLGGSITVASTYRSDLRVEDSNWGACVDLFAPGTDVLAAASGGGATRRRGTSFAAPHVTGAVAMLFEESPTLDGAAIKSEILTRSTPGVVMTAGPGSPNRLLFVR